MILFNKQGMESLTEEERAQLETLAAKAGETVDDPETSDEFISRRLEELRMEEENSRRYRESMEKNFC
ncbi:MAG: hypothetical protein J6X21_03650 [Bacteroidaceae bacterium]|nr:hypothetical protein [Bacteroidaceae bacterium]